MAETDNLRHLLPTNWKKTVSSWLDEDTPSFDYGGFVVGETDQTAILYCKAPGVLAGVPFFDEVFAQLGCRVEWFVKEGEEIDPAGGKVEAARVYGKARHLLLGERPALNMLARASGIATMQPAATSARRLSKIKQKHNWHGVIAATRKTTPGFRIVEKYASLVGGVDSHRMDLSSMIMLKDNHIWATGSITKAVQQARKTGGFALKIEVECQSEAEADEAIAAGADVVMLDNFDPPGFAVAAKNLKDRWRGKAAFLIEGSGGLTESNVAPYFGPNVDILSFGAITQSVPHIDFSLKVMHK
ncbi:nicotinate-nucleotide pyrophosphorylase-like protein [Entophlyctis helioformis]|nr:nicotinate-nucleotide pyrophosphorylase-like protein [Entophlyctis helioformis]